MTDQQNQSTGRRDALNSCSHLPHSTNPSLWFDKFYKCEKPEAAKNKQKLIEQTADLGVTSIYLDFYRGWQQVIEQQTQVLAIARVRGRMVVGTGNKGVAEAGMTLHRTYGVPFIPGSALKGLTAAYAHRFLADNTWRKEIRNEKGELILPIGEAYKTMFGDTISASYVTFFDALFVPDTTSTPLALDVVTGHHSGYYVGNEPKPPADWDSPIPAPFLTATGRYLIAIGGDEKWAKAALEILGCAMRDQGIGAKTAAGYGRMKLLDVEGQEIVLPLPPQTSDQTDPIAPNTSEMEDNITSQSELPSDVLVLLNRLNDLPQPRVATEINRFVEEWRKLSYELRIKQQVAQRIVQKVRDAGREKASADRAWYKELIYTLSKTETEQ